MRVASPTPPGADPKGDIPDQQSQAATEQERQARQRIDANQQPGGIHVDPTIQATMNTPASVTLRADTGCARLVP